MDVKNPFLFAEEEASPNSQNSNPFLMTEDDFNGGNDNPFLSQNATTISSGGSTNPFAFDAMDLGPAEAQPPEMEFKGFDANNFAATNAEANLFSNQDFLGDTNITITATAPQKPTDLDLKYTNSSDQNIFDAPPKPPKETQDLLMSVMGAMDATSSHLLDRIPPTRTPSPVSMRDLHSPSPTPEPFGDLLDVSDSRTEEQKPNDADFLMLDHVEECDVNKNHAPPKPAPPQRPSPPARPPRPALPPQKPPPPIFAQPNQVMPPQKPPQQPPQPPQPLPQVFPPKTETTQDDFMFGSIPTTAPPKPVTATDIMSLYNTPAKKPEVADLLCDTFDAKTTEGTSFPNSKHQTPEMQEKNIFENNENVQNDKTPQPVVQDNFISPEPSDLQMDTSDSQSKGSVSSVTFNPFAAQDDAMISPAKPNDVFPAPPVSDNVFQDETPMDVFAAPTTYVQPPDRSAIFPKDDAFDAFSAKFESAAQDENKNGGFDAFGSSPGDTWGDSTSGFNDGSGGFNDGSSGFNDSNSGFGQDESFDAFLAMREPPAVPQSTPNRFEKSGSLDSDEGKDFSVVIRPLSDNTFSGGILPTIAPPPAAQAVDTSRFNPFDQSEQVFAAVPPEPIQLDFEDTTLKRTDSQETPPTPLFDDDVSQPLENFPRVQYLGEGWEMQLRQPNKKKITGQRFWKKIFVKIVVQSDCTLLQLFNQQTDKDPFQELPLQPCYSVSDIGAQQYDNFGKIFTVKLQYIFYKERPGVRPGQVKKAERITNKLSQFAAYAMQGDYQGVKEFGSDLKKLGLPVEHAPQVSQLMKLGSLNYEDLKQFSVCIEEALFNLQAHRDRALHYKMEEVQITAVDELYVEQDAEGHVEKQIARVRLFFLGFLTGMPDVELGINDMRRQGKEVVGRHDIIPVVTEEWIRLENIEFHSCVQQDEYEKTHILRFKPPDACYIELLRFRIRPPRNRELPLQLKPTICITGNKIELRADVLVPGFASRKLGQVPCEDVMIRFPIPECWIYLFRVEKHFRYGSVKSAHRRTGKIKGIERILGTMDTLQESLIEVTSGQAKYEHQHRAIVWRCPRLPKEGQGAYTTHNMVCRMALTSYDQMPEQLAEYCYVEFTMPATQASHTTVRSVSLQNSDSDDPPEKYVRYLARHEYRVGIEHTEGAGPAAYEVATSVSKPAAVPVAVPEAVPEAPESSSDSD